MHPLISIRVVNLYHFVLDAIIIAQRKRGRWRKEKDEKEKKKKENDKTSLQEK